MLVLYLFIHWLTYLLTYIYLQFTDLMRITNLQASLWTYVQQRTFVLTKHICDTVNLSGTIQSFFEHWNTISGTEEFHVPEYMPHFMLTLCKVQSELYALSLCNSYFTLYDSTFHCDSSDFFSTEDSAGPTAHNICVKTPMCHKLKIFNCGHWNLQ